MKAESSPARRGREPGLHGAGASLSSGWCREESGEGPSATLLSAKCRPSPELQTPSTVSCHHSCAPSVWQERDPIGHPTDTADPSRTPGDSLRGVAVPGGTSKPGGLPLCLWAY